MISRISGRPRWMWACSGERELAQVRESVCARGVGVRVLVGVSVLMESCRGAGRRSR